MSEQQRNFSLLLDSLFINDEIPLNPQIKLPPHRPKLSKSSSSGSFVGHNSPSNTQSKQLSTLQTHLDQSPYLLNFQDDHGISLLHRIVSKKDWFSEEIFEFILSQKDTNINIKTKKGDTFLHILTRQGWMDIENVIQIFKKAKKKGFEPNVTNDKGDNLMFELFHSKKKEYINKKNMKRFIDLGVDEKNINKKKSSLLHLAVFHQANSLISSLIRWEIDVNLYSNEFSGTAIDLALRNSQTYSIALHLMPYCSEMSFETVELLNSLMVSGTIPSLSEEISESSKLKISNDTEKKEIINGDQKLDDEKTRNNNYGKQFYTFHRVQAKKIVEKDDFDEDPENEDRLCDLGNWTKASRSRLPLPPNSLMGQRRLSSQNLSEPNFESLSSSAPISLSPSDPTSSNVQQFTLCSPRNIINSNTNIQSNWKIGSRAVGSKNNNPLSFSQTETSINSDIEFSSSQPLTSKTDLKSSQSEIKNDNKNEKKVNTRISDKYTRVVEEMDEKNLYGLIHSKEEMRELNLVYENYSSNISKSINSFSQPKKCSLCELVSLYRHHYLVGGETQVLQFMRKHLTQIMNKRQISLSYFITQRYLKENKNCNHNFVKLLSKILSLGLPEKEKKKKITRKIISSSHINLHSNSVINSSLRSNSSPMNQRLGSGSSSSSSSSSNSSLHNSGPSLINSLTSNGSKFKTDHSVDFNLLMDNSLKLELNLMAFKEKLLDLYNQSKDHEIKKMILRDNIEKFELENYVKLMPNPEATMSALTDQFFVWESETFSNFLKQIFKLNPDGRLLSDGTKNGMLGILVRDIVLTIGEGNILFEGATGICCGVNGNIALKLLQFNKKIKELHISLLNISHIQQFLNFGTLEIEILSLPDFQLSSDNSSLVSKFLLSLSEKLTSLNLTKVSFSTLKLFWITLRNSFPHLTDLRLGQFLDEESTVSDMPMNGSSDEDDNYNIKALKTLNSFSKIKYIQVQTTKPIQTYQFFSHLQLEYLNFLVVKGSINHSDLLFHFLTRNLSLVLLDLSQTTIKFDKFLKLKEYPDERKQRLEIKMFPLQYSEFPQTELRELFYFLCEKNIFFCEPSGEPIFDSTDSPSTSISSL